MFYLYVNKYCIYANLMHILFEVFLGPKNQVCIRMDAALDVHAKSEITISLLVGS